MLKLINAFSIEMIAWFYSFILLTWWIILLLFKIKLTLNSWSRPIWLWYTILYIYHGIWFVNILFRTFHLCPQVRLDGFTLFLKCPCHTLVVLVSSLGWPHKTSCKFTPFLLFCVRFFKWFLKNRVIEKFMYDWYSFYTNYLNIWWNSLLKPDGLGIFLRDCFKLWIMSLIGVGLFSFSIVCCVICDMLWFSNNLYISTKEF